MGSISVIWAKTSLDVSLDAIRPLLKLLAIPCLILQFRKSENGYLLVAGYLVSCTVLLAAALISMAFPIAAWGWGFKYPGMPVKNAITQSMEFATCGFALLWFAGTSLSQRRYDHTFILVVWAILFFGAIFYVAMSRTELIVLVVLFALLFSKWFGWKGGPIGLAVAGLVFSLVWVTSPNMRWRVNHISVGASGISRKQPADVGGRSVGILAQIFGNCSYGPFNRPRHGNNQSPVCCPSNGRRWGGGSGYG